MILFLLAYLGGIVTIASPCILPVLPFVFARADRPFLRSGLPMLVGMVLAFAAVATLASVAGGWAVATNEYGRLVAIALLAVFGLALVFPSLSDRLARPLVAAGARLSDSASREERAGGAGAVPFSLLLGVATGLIWAPCAGPILGLLLTGAALQGASAQTTVLLLAYAAGAATSLGLALLVGGRVFVAMKRSLGAGEWVRRGAGVAVLAAVAAIAFGLDTGFLTRVSLASTATLEQRLVDTLGPPHDGSPPSSAVMAGAPAMSGSPAMMGANPAMTGANPAMAGANPGMMMSGAGHGAASEDLPVEGTMPPLDGAVAWLNGPPLTAEGLRGKVVLIDFWTYSCINCLRALPYVRAWAETYRDSGLVVIGVHAPEFAFEKSVPNVTKAVADLKLGYPIAIDNDYAIWRAFQNRYWPAHYFIDGQGRIRHRHFGEGDYAESERIIRQLLAENGTGTAPTGRATVSGAGAQAPSAEADVKSPETYIGYQRAENFVSPGGAIEDEPHTYAAGQPRLNEWSLAGGWTVAAEEASSAMPDGSLTYRFHARDLHLVLGPAMDGKPVRFRVTLDGKPPGSDHGVDVDANGEGIVTEQRLYQLVRQMGGVADRTFEIRFLDPGIHAYAFTFG